MAFDNEIEIGGQMREIHILENFRLEGMAHDYVIEIGDAIDGIHILPSIFGHKVWRSITFL